MKRILTAAAFIASIFISAQSKNIFTRNMSWGIVQSDFEFNKHWSAALDMQFRYEYTDGDIFQWLIRPSVAYKTSAGWQFIAGYGRFALYPNPNGLPARPEQRAWQEVARKWTIGEHHSLTPKIRFEQRFIKGYALDGLADHYDHNSERLRLRLDYKYLFHKDAHLFLLAGEEYMIQRLDDGFTVFDQNRAWVGAGYKFNPHFTLQASYLFLHQRRNATTADQFHVIRLAAVFAFKREKKEVKVE